MPLSSFRRPSVRHAVLVALLWLAAGRLEAALNTNNLGARYDPGGTSITFRVYSARATRIALSVYSAPIGQHEVVSYTLTKDAATSVWSRTVSVSALQSLGVSGTVYYGYRAWGPNWPYNASWTKGSGAGFGEDVDVNGNRFNPNKLLIDPYTRELSHDPKTPSWDDDSVYVTGPSHRNRDSGRWASKSIVLSGDSVSVGTKPTRALRNDVVYEVHLRGLTRGEPAGSHTNGSGVDCRGTYWAAGRKAAYLSTLGITAVEFLPVQESQNDTNEVDPASNSGDGYWGYSTLAFFAPDRRYACDKTPGGPTREWKAMTRALHDAGIKVLVDVVYNHGAEGGSRDSTRDSFGLLSLRGLDNRSYYSLTGDFQWPWDNTGVDGNYNTYNTAAQDLIVDSLAYWKDSLGVDGFRFDLASILGNRCQHGCFDYDKLDEGTALNRIVREMPARPAAGGSGPDWIAEPWALNHSEVYQVGNFPWGWAEWNDQYRDTFRIDQNKLGLESITPLQLARRIAGSSDLFEDDGRKPYHSINFIVAHDGMTLKDLYSCNDKNNDQPWPFGPSDGGRSAGDERVWDQGGAAADQRRAVRNATAFLMLSAGTPMMTGGDEYLRSLNCNNNPYNLDSLANWLKYTGWTTAQTDFNTFAKRLIRFRKDHAALRPANFYATTDNNGNGMEQHRWFTPAGNPPDGAYWDNPNNHALAFRIDGSELGDSVSALYVAYNGWSGNVTFRLPWPGSGKTWYRVTDTCNWAEGPNQVRPAGSEDLIGGEWTQYGVCGRGLLLLIAK